MLAAIFGPFCKPLIVRRARAHCAALSGAGPLFWIKAALDIRAIYLATEPLLPARGGQGVAQLIPDLIKWSAVGQLHHPLPRQPLASLCASPCRDVVGHELILSGAAPTWKLWAQGHEAIQIPHRAADQLSTRVEQIHSCLFPSVQGTLGEAKGSCWQGLSSAFSPEAFSLA